MTASGGIRRARRVGRRLTAGLRPLPDFVVLGAQRSGTTSLAAWLWSHPAVRPPLLGEVHFFDLHYDRGLRWYQSQFPLWRPGGSTGETSPYLLFHPLAPARAARDLAPETKFVVVLRDPVERAISHYWHCRRMEVEPLSLADAIEAEPARLASEREHFARSGVGYHHRHHSYVARGEYAGQVRRWFECVGRERVRVLESDELFQLRATLSDLLAWLGLSPWDAPFPACRAAARLEESDPRVVARLQEHFEPRNDELRALLGRPLWSATLSRSAS